MPAPPTTYRAGTLTYTRRGLFVLSFWLLWGDFAFNFFEAVFGRFLPIYLKELEASNTLIGLLTGSFAGLVNVVFLPYISQWGDSFRSRFGRRIPLLCVFAPLTVASLVGVGFAPELARLLFRGPLAAWRGPFAEGTLVLGVLSLFVVSYHFFNMVLVNAYNWLIRDVVPLPVMSRFLAWFRIIGTVSTVFFLWLVFPHLLTHRREICLGVGALYLLCFFLMCLVVKEGDYPPPAPKSERPGFFRSFVTYFRESWSVPLYRNFFIVNFLVFAGFACANPFIVLFAKNSLGAGMDSLGMIFSWTAALSALVYFPLGWLADRYSPIHVTIGAIVGMVAVALAAPLFIRSGNSFFVYSLVAEIPLVGWRLGSIAVAMKLFPSEKFGQFSSGLNVFGCGALIVGNWLIGMMMDAVGSNYRFAFLWLGLLAAAALPFMILVLRDWRRHGGPDNYAAPLPAAR
jgi:MFS-type transporter involved in bile tolerance (Atg22 family)